MKIVSINDIEDLILAKHEIDLLRIEHKEISERSDLNEFIKSYAMTDYVYLINDKHMPFSFINIYDNMYLFVTEYCEENKLLVNKLKHLKYNLNNMIKLSNSDLTKMENPNNVIIYDGNYYN